MSEDESSVDLSFLSEGDSEDEEVAKDKYIREEDPETSLPGRSIEASGLGHEEQEQQQQQHGEEQKEDEQETGEQKLKKRKKVLSSKKLQRIKEQHRRRGILYMSRIPPHMKPAKIKQLLSQYGEIGRIYCKPEDASIRKQRIVKGGNTGKNFTEGWIEFEDKAVAKQVAAMLNGKQIGGKKRSAYYYDLWNLKYLPKFKWDHLTEEIAYEKAVREQKLAQELSAARKERDFYLSRVDRAKAVKAMSERRAGKAPAAGDGEGSDGPKVNGNGLAAAAAGDSDDPAGTRTGKVAEGSRHYGQRRAKPDPVSAGPAHALPDDLLDMVVAKKRKVT